MKTYRIAFLFFLGIISINNIEIQGKPSFFVKEYQQKNDSTYAKKNKNKEELTKRVRERGKIRVYVHLKMLRIPEHNLSQLEKIGQRSNIKRLTNAFKEDLYKNGFDSTVIQGMKFTPKVGMSVDKELLEYLFETPLVAKIEEIRFGKAHLLESTSKINADKAWNLGITGEGETIVIIDTGVDNSHSMLLNKVVDGACFSTHDPINNIYSTCPSGGETEFGISAGVDCDINGCDHGTHVAGIAAGNDQSLSGVAKQSSVISIQVFSEVNDSNECGNEPIPCLVTFGNNLESALEYIYNTLRFNYNIASINMSLGFGSSSSICTADVHEPIIADILSTGISVVASSGNDGLLTEMASPACIPGVISVGSVNDTDHHSGFSNAASFLDLVAPGENITSSVPNGTAAFNGTSQAAPHVAGTIALMKSVASSLTPSEIVNILQTTAFWDNNFMGASPPSSKYGYGRLDTYEAVKQALFFNPDVEYIIDQNTTWNTPVEVDNDIYIMDGASLTVNNWLVLEERADGRAPTIYVFGELKGSSSGRVVLIDDSRISFGPGSQNNLSGYINKSIQTEATFTQNETFGNNYQLLINPGGTLNLQDGATLTTEVGTIVYLDKNSEISLSSSASQNLSSPPITNVSKTITNISEEDPPKNNSKEKTSSSIPVEFDLSDNYPNPFNPETVIEYSIPFSTSVNLTVYDLLGRKITELVNESQDAGTYSIRWNASKSSSGIYIYRIQAGEFIQTKQMILLK